MRAFKQQENGSDLTTTIRSHEVTNEMGKLNPEQIPNTIKFLREDFPELLLAIGNIEDTDEYWQEVISECHAVYSRNKNEFSKHMIIALAEYLEKQSKGRNKNGK